MATLETLRDDVLAWLGDVDERVWTGDEVDAFLQTAYRELAQVCHLFPDWTYLEDLPATFTHTASWETPYATFQAGIANYTMPDERTLLTEISRIGPAWATSPFEVTDGHLEDSGASTAIPATSEVPDTVTEIERVLWDTRTIDALSLSEVRRRDTRYHLTTGEVYGYLWREDGARTFRKVRVPAAQGATQTVIGSWGLLRNADDLED